MQITLLLQGTAQKDAPLPSSPFALVAQERRYLRNNLLRFDKYLLTVDYCIGMLDLNDINRRCYHGQSIKN